MLLNECFNLIDLFTSENVTSPFSVVR